METNIEQIKHRTYVINLQERADRRLSAKKVFKNHTEFDVSFFNAIKHKIGAQGLFASFQAIVKKAALEKSDYVIICEDDHAFTTEYSATYLHTAIEKGNRLGFDVLLGGMSNVHDVLFLDEQLIWLGGFTGLQFTVMFACFFDRFLEYTLPEGANLDINLTEISNSIYGLYPAISIQKTFGYSDITMKNNDMNVETYFEECNLKLDRLYKVHKYFEQLKGNKA